MKKLISIFLIILSSCLITSCGDNTFFQNQLLKNAMIQDIQRPENVEKMHLYNSSTLLYNSTEEDFLQYATYLYNYLKEKNFKILGYGGEVLYSMPYPLGLGDIETIELFQSNKIEDHKVSENVFYHGGKDICYEFIYGNEVATDTALVDAVRINLEYDKEDEYNIKMTIDVKNRRSNYITDGDLYRYDINIETTKYLYDLNVPTTSPIEREIVLKVYPSFKDLLKVFYNGKEISGYLQNSGEYLEYSFLMPKEDVYITFELRDTYVKDLYPDLEKWIRSSYSLELKEYELTNTLGELTTIKCYDDEEFLENFITQLCNSKVTLIENEEIIDLNTNKKLIFTINSEYKLIFIDSYLYVDGAYYNVENFDLNFDSIEYELRYSFPEHLNKYEIYKQTEKNGIEYLKTSAGLSNWEFIPCEEEKAPSWIIPTYYIECELGTIYIYSAVCFSIKSEYYDQNVYYEVVSGVYFPTLVQ